MSNLINLYKDHNQSPWLDNLKRSWIDNGQLERRIQQGIRGLTSNPSILANSIKEGDDYNIELYNCLERGLSIRESFWELAISDIIAATKLFESTYNNSKGVDGFVSLEVSPELAHNEAGTIEAARTLSNRVSKENLMIKVPATDEGIKAIEQLTSEQRSINATLIFSIKRYKEVLEAYISGLEKSNSDIENVSSVASFFISRIDTVVDEKLDELGTEQALELKGTIAISQAKVAYKIFKDTMASSRWEKLSKKGAKPQRLLWASTSTKNPDYPDTKYIDGLIAAKTVNTMPDVALDAFIDHGKIEATIDKDFEEAEDNLKKLKDLGIDLDEIGKDLEIAGLEGFQASFVSALEALESKLNK